MGIFDFFKKNKMQTNNEQKNHFDDELEMYVIEIGDVLFAFEDVSNERTEDYLKSVADKYWNKLNIIIEFMIPDLQDVYGDIDNEMVKNNLGRPTVYLDKGLVEYAEQTLDDVHVFSFEFVGDEFEELDYFSIDG